MMKLFLIIFIFLTTNASAHTPEVICYRRMMEAAYLNEDTAQAFYQSTRKISESGDPLLLGFKAMAELMMCRHILNPWAKLTRFNKGKKILEIAISKEQNSAELRFMRFCTQRNVPAILQYNNNIESDKAFLIRYLKNKDNNRDKDEGFELKLKAYLLEHKLCDSMEKTVIKNL